MKPYLQQFNEACLNAIAEMRKNGCTVPIGIIIASDVDEKLGQPRLTEVFGCQVLVSEYLEPGKIFAMQQPFIQDYLKQELQPKKIHDKVLKELFENISSMGA